MKHNTLGRRIVLAAVTAAVVSGGVYARAAAVGGSASDAAAATVTAGSPAGSAGSTVVAGTARVATAAGGNDARLMAAGSGERGAANFAPLRLSDGSVVEAKSTMKNYLTAALLNVDTFWKASFKAGNLPTPGVNYQWPAKGESLPTRCDAGGTTDRSGMYCSLDDTITVNEEYARKLWVGQYDLGSVVRTGQPGGDFGVAVLVAHEYGHQVQNEMGWDRRGLAQRNLEQDADCLAGVWAHYAYSVVEQGDITEAYNALTDLADDATTDQNHGTAPERIAAFNVGYTGGQPHDCTAQFIG